MQHNIVLKTMKEREWFSKKIAYCQCHLSDIRKSKPEHFLALPFLRQKLERSSGIKVGFMSNVFTCPLSNIGIMTFGRELLISFYMS